MLPHPTLEKLSALKLNGMRAAVEEQLGRTDLEAMPFLDRLALLVEREAAVRADRQLTARLRAAKLRYPEACVEGINRHARRKLSGAVLEPLFTSRWVTDQRNVLITGPTGVGKSYLACALAQKACRDGYRAYYARLPRLLGELTLARADGTYARRFAELAKAQVLVLDDFGLGALDDTDRRELLELLEDRYRRRSTVIASQLPIAQWYEVIGDATLADAILDRVVHNSYRLEMQGESMRRSQDALEATTSESTP
ncbi:AAA family ATPase [Halorhodospira abdelmalekii]|uniref:IS21-like element helper ATPase IstB n=1 Tax=Halorhodospira abdelmalekii TaxID=421629 RepID=UPI001902FA20|nr:IS21-like element helper ATPase IstB [Halorhodospira abdelmalekii]MBK1736309.1 AAA family ATPase [Halorhodospira abdelmalekii]